jgi:hypothetical protein
MKRSGSASPLEVASFVVTVVALLYAAGVLHELRHTPDPAGWRWRTHTTALVGKDDNGRMVVSAAQGRACFGPEELTANQPRPNSLTFLRPTTSAEEHISQCELVATDARRSYIMRFTLPRHARIDRFGGVFGIDQDSDHPRPEETVQFRVSYGPALMCDRTIHGRETKRCPRVSGQDIGPHGDEIRVTQIARSDAVPPIYAGVIGPSVEWREDRTWYRVAAGALALVLVAVIVRQLPPPWGGPANGRA